MAQLSGTADNPTPVARRNVKRFRGGLIFEAHRLLYHSTPGLRVIKKKKKSPCGLLTRRLLAVERIWHI